MFRERIFKKASNSLHQSGRTSVELMIPSGRVGQALLHDAYLLLPSG